MYLSIFISWHIFHLIAGVPAPAVRQRTARLEAAPFVKQQPRVLGAYAEAGPRLAVLNIHQMSALNRDPFHKTGWPAKKPGATDIQLKSASALIVDAVSGKVLLEKNKDHERRIASITKLMTALVFLDLNPGWDQTVEIKDEYRRQGGRIFLFKGEKVTVRDLFYASLVASGNSETIALVSSTRLTEEQFVAKMNEKAAALGFKITSFKDAVGLSNENVSTAFEIAILANLALDRKEIQDAVLTKTYKFKTKAGVEKFVATTDKLLNSYPDGKIDILGGKTGYTDVAGYCFVGKFKDQAGHAIISVILDAPGLADRFSETRQAVDWAYDSFSWGD